MAGKKNGSVAAWFEIPAGDFERAVAFYEKSFATKLVREAFGPTQLAIFPHDPEVSSGCIVKGADYVPGKDGCVVYIEAAGDLDATLDRAKAQGGRVHTPKTALPPGMGYFAHFVDSEGNRVGLHSME